MRRRVARAGDLPPGTRVVSAAEVAADLVHGQTQRRCARLGGAVQPGEEGIAIDAIEAAYTAHEYAVALAIDHVDPVVDAAEAHAQAIALGRECMRCRAYGDECTRTRISEPVREVLQFLRTGALAHRRVAGRHRALVSARWPQERLRVGIDRHLGVARRIVERPTHMIEIGGWLVEARHLRSRIERTAPIAAPEFEHVSRRRQIGEVRGRVAWVDRRRRGWCIGHQAAVAESPRQIADRRVVVDAVDRARTVAYRDTVVGIGAHEPGTGGRIGCPSLRGIDAPLPLIVTRRQVGRRQEAEDAVGHELPVHRAGIVQREHDVGAALRRIDRQQRHLCGLAERWAR